MSALNVVGSITVVVTIVIVVMVVVSMLFSHGQKYKKIDLYTLDQPWTHGPLLFSATGEAAVGGGHGGHGGHHDGDAEFIGGAASGKW